MRLLVSVRSVAEVAAAVAGGAAIVDAKEPALGPLGCVDAPTLRRIAHNLPRDIPLSIALGDLPDPSAVCLALTRLDAIERRPSELYVKIGLAGVREPASVRAVLGAAVACAARSSARPLVVAVAYADYETAQAPPYDLVADVAAEVGARGVLLDTWTKDGRDLFSWLAEAELVPWLETSKRRGLLTALAGSLSIEGVRRATELAADVVGVRGAACDGGRSGTIDERRVRALAQAISDGVGRAEVVA